MNRTAHRHRLLGALFLIAALCLLILGETLFKGRLDPVTALIYWITALVITGGAIACALLDALRSFGRSRREQRQLLEATLQGLDAERPSRGEPPG